MPSIPTRQPDLPHADTVPAPLDPTPAIGTASAPAEPPAAIVEPVSTTSNLPGFLLAAGFVVISFTLFIRVRRIRARRLAERIEPPTPARSRQTGEAARDRINQTEADARARQTLDALMVEVQELTRTCAAQIENRALRLERLISHADERIDQLRGLTSPRSSSSSTGQPLDQPTIRAVPDQAAAVRNARSDAHIGVRSIAPSADPTTSSSASPERCLPPHAIRAASVLATPATSSITTPAMPNREIKPQLDPLTRRVYRLADTGKSPVEIARALEEQIGKVELILTLRDI